MNAVPQVATAVLGAGAWGTALAARLAANGQPTTLWGRDAVQLSAIKAAGINQNYLPDIKLPAALQYESSLELAITAAQDVLLVIPSHVFAQTLISIKPFMRHDARLFWASKGFEPSTGRLLHQVAEEILGEQCATAVITGPTFALEVAKGMPTALTVASHEQTFANELASRLRSETFRAYTSSDMVGVEVGGAVKNVLAIAAGISDGLGFGANARAALITRGLHEIVRLGEALGGRSETFVGLAGLGDLVLTCTDNQSRNRRFGLAIGRGEDQGSAKAAIKQVVEGADAAREAYQLAQKLNIDMPITEQVYRVLYENRSPREAVHHLLTREQKPELG